MELQRLAEGKELNDNDVKGILLERPVSDTLNTLGIRHTHNPFTNAYPCFQNKGPDIAIDKISTVIECKNLSETQVKHLSNDWLDENIINRPYFAKYRRKIALFSYKPRIQLVRYLNKHGWKVYDLNRQLLTSKQAIKAKDDLIKKFYWLKKEYNGDRL
jgi:hypothetical protein